MKKVLLALFLVLVLLAAIVDFSPASIPPLRSVFGVVRIHVLPSVL